MHSVATASIMVGIVVAYFAQIVGAILLFRTSILKGVLSQSVISDAPSAAKPSYLPQMRRVGPRSTTLCAENVAPRFTGDEWQAGTLI
jgi:hypothetical protein